MRMQHIMSERGSALLFAVICALLMITLGLGLTVSSLVDFSMSDELEGHDQALFIAEAGLAESVRQLRGRQISDLLSATADIPVYVEAPTYYRNPLSFADARNIDFAAPPSPLSTVQLAGVLTPAGGQAYANGRYFARVSDNDDGDNDLMHDLDGEIYVRSLGIRPAPAQELETYGSRLANSVSMVEGAFDRDMSFDIGSPFNVYGAQANPAANNFFNGSSFKIDGYDHSSMTVEEILQGGHGHGGDSDSTALTTLNDDAGSGDGSQSLDTIHDSLTKNQEKNLVGAEGAYGSTPSMSDGTEAVRTSGNEDATNVFSPTFMSNFIKRVTSAADIHYASDQSLSGNGVQLGTEDDPKVVVADGDLAVSGNGSGSGILVVKGKLDFSSSFNYNGLVLVVGEGSVEMSGANKSLIGGLYLANLQEDANGNPSFGNPSFTISGNSNFYFRSKSIRMAISLLPFKTIGWREITADIATTSTQ